MARRQPDADSDGDGALDCQSGCPGDSGKTEPDICGCFVPDVDSDLDGVVDCIDPCPADNPDDTDGDGVCDSDDRCPGDDDTVDLNGNGVPDCMEIPTLSTWALIVLALGLFAVGRHCFRHRQHTRTGPSE